MTQAELARRSGISRQALSAIESGTYQPSVNVALRLARELGETVENLFGGQDDPGGRSIAVDEPSLRREKPPFRVSLARVGGRLVAIRQPAARLALLPSAGVLDRPAASNPALVSTFLSSDEIDSTLLIAGCDPAVAILADWLARHRSPVRATTVQCSSGAALELLLAGRAHVAGVHLRDRRSGRYNIAQVRKSLGQQRYVLVNFARWELGMATAPGNPLGLSGWADLARPGIRIVNREKGSGARLALDEALDEHGLPAAGIAGYKRELPGHLEIAAAIAAGEADAGVTLRVAADASGLGFVPLREERYDLVFMERDRETKPVSAMMEAIHSASFASELHQLCTYDTHEMGSVVAAIR